ncbi:MAG: nucleotidyltransferase [Bacteroidetes bacterium]|nr:nucleotidyltransferase [Bacteroidota bacterium]
MDVSDEQLMKFWAKLNSNQVRYIMIGGFATRFHGFNRNTDDIDMWIDDTSANRKNLRKAFEELGYGDLESLETMDFVPGWTTFYAAGIELDILTEMKGLKDLSFDECLKLASVADIDGLKIPFLHINHLIENKKAVNRLKDQVDVLELERIREIRDRK